MRMDDIANRDPKDDLGVQERAMAVFEDWRMNNKKKNDACRDKKIDVGDRPAKKMKLGAQQDQDVTGSQNRNRETVNSDAKDKPTLERYAVRVPKEAVAPHRSTIEELEKFYLGLIKQAGCPESQYVFGFNCYFFVNLTEEEAEKLGGVEDVEMVCPYETKMVKMPRVYSVA